MYKRIRIRSYEVGLHFRDGEFKGLLSEGRHWLFDPLLKHRVDIVSRRDPWLVHDKLDMIVKSGALGEHATVVDLKDHERALVWVDGRFHRILSAGLYAYWNGMRDVRVETVDARSARFEHDDLKVIVRAADASRLLDVCAVNRNCASVLFVDGRFVDTLAPHHELVTLSQSQSELPIYDSRYRIADPYCARRSSPATFGGFAGNW